MRKRLSFVLFALFMAFFAVGCDACGGAVVSAVLDDKAPWNMPTLYERSEFSVQKYKMKEENKTAVKDVLLGEGTMRYLLTEAGKVNGIDCARLTMEFSFTYNDNEINGENISLTDTISSEVVFQKTSLSPVSSLRTVNLAMRKTADGKDKQNNSHVVTADYATGESKLQWTKRGETEAINTAIGASGQVFDNEQLFFAMRAFSAMKVNMSQGFKLFNAFDRQIYNVSMNVAAETVDKYLTGYKGDNDYGFGTEEDPTPKVECFNVTTGKTDTPTGPSWTAYFSAKPFKISENIETYKVLTGIETAEYDVNSSASYKTFYTLIDYAATTDNA